jgi:hypothetical protein
MLAYIPSGKCPEVVLMDGMVGIFLVKLFSIMVAGI